MASRQPAPAAESLPIGVEPFSQDEATSMFERMTRRYLKMSAADFLERLESGYFEEHPELNRRVSNVLFYLPLIQS